MRIFFSVGEPSGDLHGSNLIRHLKSQTLTKLADDCARTEDPSLEAPQPIDIECVGFGGPKMEAAGCDLHFDLTSMAVMFIGQVLKNLRLFFRLIGEADEYFANHQVDAVVLIDYPGFNWWIARKAKKRGIPVFYYGVPQMWAWAPWRIKKIRKFVDHVLCKLPFEANWFQQRNCTATYVGHPYFDQIEHQTYDEEYIQQLESSDKRLLTLLPGSRDQEVVSVLPVLIDAANQVANRVDNLRIVVASYNQKQFEMARALIADRQNVNKSSEIEVMVDRTPELMRAADVCLACSGSVSMELMHYRTPTIIVFKIKRWVMAAQSIMLRAKFITLVNLIATDDIRKTTWGPFDPDANGAENAVMPEYLTTGNPSQQVAKRAIEWLSNEDARQTNVQRLNELALKHARPGATKRAAAYLIEQLGMTAIASPADPLVNQKTISKNASDLDKAVRKTA